MLSAKWKRPGSTCNANKSIRETATALAASRRQWYLLAVGVAAQSAAFETQAPHAQASGYTRASASAGTHAACASYMPSKNTSAPITRLVKPAKHCHLLLPAIRPPTMPLLTKHKRRLTAHWNGTRNRLGQQRCRVLSVHNIGSNDNVKHRKTLVPRALPPWQLLNAAHMRQSAVGHVGREQLHHAAITSHCITIQTHITSSPPQPADIRQHNTRRPHARGGQALEAEAGAENQHAFVANPVRLIHQQLR